MLGQPLLLAFVALAQARGPAVDLASPRTVDTVVLRSGQTLAEALYRLDLSSAQVQASLAALAPVLDFRKTREGDQLRLERSGDQLTFLELRDGPAAEWCVRRDGDRLIGWRREATVVTRVVEVDAVLHSSLYQAFTDAGEDPRLALAIADVFAWDVDFYLDPRQGDRIHAVVERRQIGEKIVGYGEVLAAEYEGAGDTRQVFRYLDRKGQVGYYDAAGRAARRSFLKSPLKFSRISSGFGMRMHPTLHYRKAHQGVDYVAATGTPVWSVGDGTVIAAGFKGANGNYVGIRHQNGLETFYCHLSHLGAGIRAGVKVLQKRLIGYVGMTGRATGPHLHFALKRGGSFINPLSFRVPRAEPLPRAELSHFRAAIAPLMERLHHAPVAALVRPAAFATR